jgi:hypothetical protein
LIRLTFWRERTCTIIQSRNFFLFGSTLTKIIKKNFKKMSVLRELFLNENQISTINSDTFEYLTGLNKLHLCKKIKWNFQPFLKFFCIAGNKIQFMNGRTFVGLTKLTIAEYLSSSRWSQMWFQRHSFIKKLGIYSEVRFK